MTIEFIGMIQPRQQSEIHPARGPRHRSRLCPRLGAGA